VRKDASHKAKVIQLPRDVITRSSSPEVVLIDQEPSLSLSLDAISLNETISGVMQMVEHDASICPLVDSKNVTVPYGREDNVLSPLIDLLVYRFRRA